METVLNETQRFARHDLRTGSESATALSQWIGRPVRLTVSSVEQLPLAEASELLRPGDDLVAACGMLPKAWDR
ncbi:MAG: hypothetical protein U0794_06810 [Isosphaeraceae bacterium]